MRLLSHTIPTHCHLYCSARFGQSENFHFGECCFMDTHSIQSWDISCDNLSLGDFASSVEFTQALTHVPWNSKATKWRKTAQTGKTRLNGKERSNILMTFIEAFSIQHHLMTDSPVEHSSWMHQYIPIFVQTILSLVTCNKSRQLDLVYAIFPTCNTVCST